LALQRDIQMQSVLLLGFFWDIFGEPRFFSQLNYLGTYYLFSPYKVSLQIFAASFKTLLLQSNTTKPRNSKTVAQREGRDEGKVSLWHGSCFLSHTAWHICLFILQLHTKTDSSENFRTNCLESADRMVLG